MIDSDTRRRVVITAIGLLAGSIAGCLRLTESEPTPDVDSSDRDDSSNEVEETEPASEEFELLNLFPVSRKIGQESEVTITATVHNTGGPGTKEVEWWYDGETVRNQSFELQHNERRLVRFDINTDELAEGTHRHTIWTEDDTMEGRLIFPAPDDREGGDGPRYIEAPDGADGYLVGAPKYDGQMYVDRTNDRIRVLVGAEAPESEHGDFGLEPPAVRVDSFITEEIIFVWASDGHSLSTEFGDTIETGVKNEGEMYRWEPEGSSSYISCGEGHLEQGYIYVV